MSFDKTITAFEDTGEERQEPVGVQGFDFEEVFTRLDGHEESEALREAAMEMAAYGVREFLVWLLFTAKGQLRESLAIGRVVRTLGQMMNLIELTQTDLAALDNITKANINKVARRCEAAFGLRAPGSKMGEARAAYATRARAVHARRKAAKNPRVLPAI